MPFLPCVLAALPHVRTFTGRRGAVGLRVHGIHITLFTAHCRLSSLAAKFGALSGGQAVLAAGPVRYAASFRAALHLHFTSFRPHPLVRQTSIQAQAPKTNAPGARRPCLNAWPFKRAVSRPPGDVAGQMTTSRAGGTPHHEEPCSPTNLHNGTLERMAMCWPPASLRRAAPLSVTGRDYLPLGEAVRHTGRDNEKSLSSRPHARPTTPLSRDEREVRLKIHKDGAGVERVRSCGAPVGVQRVRTVRARDFYREKERGPIKTVDFRHECRTATSSSGLAKACVDFSVSGKLLVWIATINRLDQVFELEGSTHRADDESDREAVTRSVSNAIDVAIAARY